ncbi:hypothetical protein V1520DRAFT_348653 [Lipomyces starkeyi]|uniref:Uncharacterized protein n=1 Tax=Lipomyces starkeyi NRRL Y-11557 TaxID=675824 RepID=A0A1E3PY06_LIPST|nr:hypothetical protein LIPSTDRAFT_74541 [Lipomyces starkeyi NRRL Y-11557]
MLRPRMASIRQVLMHSRLVIIIAITTLVVSFLTYSLLYHRESINVSSLLVNTPGYGANKQTADFDLDVLVAHEVDNINILARSCEDPYRLPGYLYRDEYRNDTRWIPFYDDFSKLDPLPETNRNSTQQTIVLPDTKPESEFFSRAPTPWMRKLAEYQRMLQGVEYRKKANKDRPLTPAEEKIEQEMSWVRDRRVLLVGDSIDRILLRAVCSEFGVPGLVEGPGIKQATIFCEFPLMNLTFSQWHVSSMVTYKPDWWWVPAMDVVAFEDRDEQIFSKFEYRSRGKSGGPDLLLFQTGRWDVKAFSSADLIAEGKEPHLKGYWDTVGQLKWTQLRYVNTRMQKVLGLLRDKFGPEVPLMFRSIPVGRDKKTSDLGVISLDRMFRSMSEVMDFEIFDWASIVYGYSKEYSDEMHIKQGDLSWLFGDMILHYLFRASGGLEIRGEIVRWPNLDVSPWNPAANWNECHQFFVHPTNR